MPPAPLPLRIGVLGAARIVPRAIVEPCRRSSLASLRALAARSRQKADRFARRHGIPTVYPTYGALLEDPDLDAVYIPLPNSLHCHWTLRALQAGKHVLCEKPFSANAQEAGEMALAAETSGCVLMEAFHYRYHPLMHRMLDIIHSGEIGALQHVEAHFCIPVLRLGDIRYRYDLAGGALMDTGCYCVHILRALAGTDPDVTAARAWEISPGVDRRMEANLLFANGATGRLVCSLLSTTVISVKAIVCGDRGEMSVTNPILPHLYHALNVKTAGQRRREKIPGETTYAHQLHAFVQAIRASQPLLTGPEDAVANMKVIDEIYQAAGLPTRGT